MKECYSFGWMWIVFKFEYQLRCNLDCQSLAKEAGIESMPTFHLFHNRQLQVLVGANTDKLQVHPANSHMTAQRIVLMCTSQKMVFPMWNIPNMSQNKSHPFLHPGRRLSVTEPRQNIRYPLKFHLVQVCGLGQRVILEKERQQSGSSSCSR
jgi:hypothetical protein